MITLRRSVDRGLTDHGWLRSYHTFSFADYYAPQEMGFGVLRVINEDRVQPGKGFGTHGHRDMEIVSYVLEGALEHKDSTGISSVIRAGDVQRMSAGTGVMHSEYNASPSEVVHFLQIWIEPNVSGIKPEYQQIHFGSEVKRNRLCLIASGDARDGSVLIHQDASIYAALLGTSQSLMYHPAGRRRAYLHLVSGNLEVNGCSLSSGDGAKITDEPELRLVSGELSELLLFDLP
jgi:quercetin 2,3-dioxygenase